MDVVAAEDVGEGQMVYLPAILANRKDAHVGSVDLDFTKLPDGR